MHIIQTIASTTFLFLASRVLAQSAIPPSTFPDASSTPTPSSSGSSGPTVTFTVTTSLPSGSASASSSRSVSGSVSGNATSTVPFPPLNTVSPCVSNCLATAISAVGCSSVVDVNCFCPIDRFPLTYMNCVIGSCPSDSLSSAESLADQFCQLANSTTATSLSFPPVPQQTSSGNGGSGTTTITVGSAATGTNAAVAAGISIGGFGLGAQGLVSGVIVALSVILGGVVV